VLRRLEVHARRPAALARREQAAPPPAPTPPVERGVPSTIH
jgi:hypothetical protein